jgi:integrase
MIADLTAKNVTQFVCEFQRKHGATRGKSMLAVISNIWQHALGLEACRMPDQPVNPTTYAQVPRPTHKQHKAWPPDIRERFLDGAPDHLTLLFNLLLYTGQRRSDVAAMKWEHYDRKAHAGRGVIHVRQRKTGEYVPVPVHKRLAKLLAETPRVTAFIATNGHGKEQYRGESSISHAILKRLREIGVPDGLYDCHGLRVTAGHMLAEAGCNELEIMRILGHAKPDQSHYYIRESNKAKVALAGMAKWEAADEDAA